MTIKKFFEFDLKFLDAQSVPRLNGEVIKHFDMTRLKSMLEI